MTLRPKSMSTEEAAEYLASGRTNPSQDYAPITDPIDDVAGLRARLQQALREQDELPFAGEAWSEEDIELPGDQERYTAESPERAAEYFNVSQTLREQDADEQAAAQEQPAGLRSDDEIDDDLDLLVGPFALAVTPEDRHRATLRLIDDLVGARQTLRQLVGA